MDYSAKAHFGNYDPSSFGWPHAVPDLVPLSFAGTDFGHCARAAHPVFIAVLTELVPHIPGGISFGLHDDWAYSTTDDLPDGSWSFHRYGIAFDLNWRENPMGDYVTNPDTGQLGAIPHAAASAIARKYGCEYGGDWSGSDGHRGFKDYMHFEIHLSPTDAASVVGSSAPPREDDDDMANTLIIYAMGRSVWVTDPAYKSRTQLVDQNSIDEFKKTAVAAGIKVIGGHIGSTQHNVIPVSKG